MSQHPSYGYTPQQNPGAPGQYPGQPNTAGQQPAPGQYPTQTPGQYPPQQQQYGYPPQQQYGYPPQQQAYPPQQQPPYGYPPQQPSSTPPGQYPTQTPGQYPPQQQQYGYPPQQQQQYGYPPQQQQPPPYGYPPQQPSKAPGQYPTQTPGQYPAQVPGQYPTPPGQYPPQQHAYPPSQQQQPPYGYPPAAGAAVPPTPVPAQPGGGVSLVKFFDHVHHKYARDYTLIVDRSGSMAGSLWREASAAVQKIAPFACQADPDGITLYFFSSPNQHTKYDNVKDGRVVMDLFNRESPKGTTDLYGVLDMAITAHFRTNKPETILVITDGIPNNVSDVKTLLIRTANRLARDEDLSISFIQIGRDSDATRFLRTLDDELTREGARFDIVDTLTVDQMHGMSFEQLIDKSILD